MTDENEKLSPLQEEILKKWQSKKKVALNQAFKDELQIKFDGEILFDEPMSLHTSIKAGGKAMVFLKPNSKKAVLYAVKTAIDHHVPYIFHGAGANTLVRDGGIKAMVISVYDTFKEYEVLETTDSFIDIKAQSGLAFLKLVHIARDLGAADLAPFSGIPGSVGGLISMNAGVGEREIKDVLRSITVVNKDGEETTISREKLDFQYRNLKLSKTNFILEAVFRLQDLISPEEVSDLMKQYQSRRVETQPLEFPNMGSIFKNPQPQHKKDVVASAGQLIEEAGLKNVRVGGARISPKHANFIINEGNATAKDILSLVGLIKDKVKQSTGIVLETEIKIIGDEE